ncbi:MAG: hypothetical protein GQ582_05395 [Methyloprofundus sp.]|nr:hypothetical protein [Methyloprofundus sp.]
MFLSKLWIGLVVLVIAVAAGWFVYEAGVQTNHTASSASTTDHSTPAKIPELPDIVSDKQVFSPPNLQLPKQQESAIAAETQVTNQSEALAVIQEKQQQLGLGEDSHLVIKSDSSDDLGNRYYQLEQHYKGIPIYGGKSILEVEQGKAVLISGSWVKNITLDITPTATAKVALRKALDRISVPAAREVQEIGKSKLIVFPSDQGAKLCWLMQATLTQPNSEAERFIVDAQNPEILLRAAVVTE